MSGEDEPVCSLSWEAPIPAFSNYANQRVFNVSRCLKTKRKIEKERKEKEKKETHGEKNWAHVCCFVFSHSETVDTIHELAGLLRAPH